MKKFFLYLSPISLIVSIIFGIWLFRMFEYYSYMQYHYSYSDAYTRLHRSGVNTLYFISESIIEKIIPNNGKNNIYINKNNLQDLYSDLPISGFNDKKCLYSSNGRFYKAKTRLRGDSYYHWIPPRKSWKIKLSKKKLIDGENKLNYVIAKENELLNNHLSFKLAKTLGLLAPETKLASLSINSKYNGVKVLTQQLDEGFLRKNRRMPNDIYKGDNVRAGEFLGFNQHLQTGTHLWEKASYNNHYDKNNKIPLDDFLSNLLNHNFERLNLIDFSRFSALLSLTGSQHVDNIHNWRMYFDNYLEKMYPIAWDIVGWHRNYSKQIDTNNTIAFYNFVEKHLFTDMKFLYMREEVLNDFFKNKEKHFVEIIDNEIEVAKKLVKNSFYTINLDQNILDTKKSLHEVEKFKSKIVSRFEKLKDNLYQYNNDDYKYYLKNNILYLKVGGRLFIDEVHLLLSDDNKELDCSVSSGNSKLTVFTDKINNVKHKLSVKISPGVEHKQNEVVFQPNIVKVTLPENLKGKISGIEFKLHDINNTLVKVRNNKFQIKHNYNNTNAVFSDKITKNKIVLSGNLYVKDRMEIHEDVDILPGTKIILDENASIRIFGKVKALGKKEKPIIFEAKDQTKPWNAFALKDEKANGSIFKHCVFKDGSGDKGDLYEYTAMFSVHNVRDLLVEDCEFYDSHRTDDMVHVIYSDATFKNTKFVRSLSDALDVDISNVVIDNCEFVNSGNDSIDLMTTNAVVKNTRFSSSADKGISIGEGSNLLAINNFIKGSEIGMQSKDTSKAYIYNTSFIENKKAVDAYHKNWRYSKGGAIILDKCMFKNNTANATVGKLSEVVINDSDIDTPDKFDSKSINKKKIIISNDDFIMYELEGPLFKDRSSVIRKERRGYYE